MCGHLYIVFKWGWRESLSYCFPGRPILEQVEKNVQEKSFSVTLMKHTWHFLSSKHLAIQCHWSQRPAVIGDVLQVYSGSEGRAIIFCETKKNVTEMAMNPHIKQVSLFYDFSNWDYRGESLNKIIIVLCEPGSIVIFRLSLAQKEAIASLS